MRFGRRRKDADPAADEPAGAATPGAPPSTAADRWTASSAGPPEDVAPAAQKPPPYYPPDPVVEGEAVEIPADASASPTVPPAAAFEPPLAFAAAPPVTQPAAVPFPAAEQPVAVAAPGRESEHVTPLGDAAETFASGHGPAPAPAWPEGIQKLAAERPEVVVGAAFVGGILAALILRRLGN